MIELGLRTLPMPRTLPMSVSAFTYKSSFGCYLERATK